MVDISLEAAVLELLKPGSVFETSEVEIGSVRFTAFRHTPQNLAHLYSLSSCYGDRTQLVYEDERYSFAEIAQQAGNLAHHLRHAHGVRKGDRVALAMRNYPEWCVSYVAVTSIGAIIVPLNAWWQGAELAHGLHDSGARLLIADGERFARLEGYLDALDLRVLVARCDTAPSGAERLSPLLEGSAQRPEVEIEPDDAAALMYTSGSMGRPKGVLTTHRAIVSTVFAWEFIHYARGLPGLPVELRERLLTWAAGGAEAVATPPLELPQKTTLVTLPLFHVTGCNVQFLPVFRNGRKLVLMRRWNAERALELIDRERVTDFTGVPTMAWELVNSPDFAKRDTSSLGSVAVGGASQSPGHVEGIMAKAGGAFPGTGYGMTETSSLGAVIAGENYLGRPTSVGRALPPLVELKVVDPEGMTLGVDEVGEVCIKSVANMREYWRQPEESAKTLRDGWVHTGDLGRVDSEGYLFLTGRAKDIVNRGGENVSCSEVEFALEDHPAVAEAAVYPVPDARLGEAVAATVMLTDGSDVSVAELRGYLGQRLARFKVPAHIAVQRASLPRLGSGKIDKGALRGAHLRRAG